MDATTYAQDIADARCDGALAALVTLAEWCRERAFNQTVEAHRDGVVEAAVEAEREAAELLGQDSGKTRADSPDAKKPPG